MKKINYKAIAKNVIDLEISSLKKLKRSLSKSFDQAVEAIVKCQSKIVFCGVGKSAKIGAKLSSTFSSVGSPSFVLSSGDSSHGDIGSVSKKDVLILISYSGETQELKNIIQYANRNRVTLIGMVSKKNSTLYKASDIKLYIPEVKEAGHGIVPTSSTTAQLAMGDALAIASMEYKKFGKLDFKKYHPSGSLSVKLKTAEDLMVKGNNMPFINQNLDMSSALKVMRKSNMGVLIVRKNNKTVGIISDGDIKRIKDKNTDFKKIIAKKIMKKNPISVDKDTLASKSLSVMSEKKITCLCVHNKKNKNRTIGILKIHSILDSNIQ